MANEQAICDPLRQALADAKENGTSLLAISKATEISYPALHRFAAGGEIYSGSIEKLAAYFRLELRPIRKRK